MKRVYKYTLQPEEEQVVEFPKNTIILSAINQFDKMVVYAMVDTEEQITEKCSLRVYGTGHNMFEYIGLYTFLNTVSLMNGSLVFHVFYRWLQ
jgi:hypothetical protein